MTDPCRALAETLGEPVTLDPLAGSWSIFQLKRGHRFSTDDLLVAWLAMETRPDARRLLDIGAGMGSVGLMTLHAMPPDAHLTMVEAQEISHRQARASIAHNRLQDRVTPIHADLREVMLPARSFDLVTGSPPYIPVGHGVISPHPQRAGARMELRGDVSDYCRTAAHALTEDGVFCFCHAAGDARPEPAVATAGLTLRARQDVVFRRGRPATIALFVAGWGGAREDRAPLVVREADGRWTPEYRAVRQRMSAP
jgi:tRNA1Val (adenine37-N6)-methyltransferase